MRVRGIPALLMGVATVVLGTTAHGAVVVSQATAGTAFPGSPATDTSSGNLGSFTVGATLNGNAVIGQTFTATSNGQLQAVALYIGGNGGVAGTLTANLYALTVSGSGGTETDGYVNVAGNTALLGGGSGLPFNLTQSPSNQILTLTFSDADQVNLTAGSRYALTITNATGGSPMYWERIGASPSSGGNIYAVSPIGTTLNAVSGAGPRDGAFAVYTAVPEPASLAVLAGAGLFLIRRKRA